MNLIKNYLSRHEAFERKSQQNADAEQNSREVHVVVAIVLQ